MRKIKIEYLISKETRDCFLDDLLVELKKLINQYSVKSREKE